MPLSETQRQNLEFQKEQYLGHAARLDHEVQVAEAMFLSAAQEYGSELAGAPSSVAEKREQADQARVRANKIDAILELDIDPALLVEGMGRQLEGLQRQAASVTHAQDTLRRDIAHLAAITQSLPA